MNRMFSVGLVCVGVSLSSLADTQRPNIIFLMADDQSAYTLGCYGNPDVQTPNIDGLAADGIVFDNHYDTTAICMASRATVMTGMYEYKTGCNFDHGHMLTETWKKSYPVLLRESGYMTAFAGKFGFEFSDTPDGRKLPLPEDDFDRWGGSSGQSSYKTAKNQSMIAYADKYPHSTRSYGAFGSDFIQDAVSAGKPFCLSISFKAPHRPATPDPEFDHIYKGKTFKKPENFGRENGTHFSEQSRQGRQYSRFEDWGYDKKYDEVMATYHQQIYAIDVAVGMIRKALIEQGVSDNTVIIYTSDNGFFCGSHGYGSKVLPYEESVRVPMIMYDPRHSNSGKKLRSGALTGNIDFAPTLLALAGVNVPGNMDGADLMNLYEDPNDAIHESLALINVWGAKETHALGVVTSDAKYIYWNYDQDGFKPTEELYLLDRDPSEMVNQAENPEFRQQFEHMRKLYDQHVETWKAEAVPYNNYQPYGQVFDRN